LEILTEKIGLNYNPEGLAEWKKCCGRTAFGNFIENRAGITGRLLSGRTKSPPD